MVKIIAHRGASYDAPENTMAAIELGWQRGADLVEIDVHRTADGQLAAIHDATTTRTTGVEGRVEDMSLAALARLDAGSWKGPRWAGARIPGLVEVLSAIPAGKQLLIEVKGGPRAIPSLLAQLDTAGTRPEQIIVQGFEHEAMHLLKRQRPELRVFGLIAFRRKPDGSQWPGLTEILARCSSFDGLGLGSDGPLDVQSCAAMRAAGLQLFVWTVDKLPQARALVAAGVDGIITNRPGWLRAQLGAV